ncbi:DNA internalization-related competence protein ComEC/Rec2 [Planococcus donghaensis]|uniref:DNA internalization-related competence protein ComEC/Rec2 n=1 Tax=Planococcus donghaensis TaxID=414778 RepID=A0A1C7EIP6_9BACL|nr:DNA internalization-related competence protein ComEC/Rec2 [Planococcus donghaensis]ANU23536.1 DNA internalization-related competence protein ComEC/Rec2 [Planococcus donghaensis]
MATYAAHETAVQLVFMALLFSWMYWKKEKWTFIVLILLFGCTVYIVQDLRSQDFADYSQPYSGELIFREDAVIDGDSLRGFAEIQDGTLVYARYRLTSNEQKLQIGSILLDSKFLVNGVFEPASPPSHRYSFNMTNYLRHNGAASLLKIESITGVVKNKTWVSYLYKRRELFQHHIREHFPENLATEAEALLIGERENMDPEDQRMYQTLGISHLFAISGLHVGIASGLLYVLLIRLHIRKETALVVLLGVLPLYAVIAGGAPSVWRAVCMVVIITCGKLINFKVPIANVMLTSVVFFVLWNPYGMYKIGFQLSYGATFGIIYSMKQLSAIKSPVKTGFMITFISQVTLYPFLLFHFYELSLSAFIVNSLFVPLFTLIILPANFLLLFLTAVFPPAANFVFYFYEPLRQQIDALMNGLASLPYQVWVPGKPGLVIFVLLKSSVYFFYCAVERKFRWRHLLILIVPALLFTLMPYMDPRLKVTFLDVGQGDSAVIELPYRQAVYLIDSGGLLRFDVEAFKEKKRPYEIGRQIVAPYLKGQGISSLDALILSHPDADHAEGAEEIFELFQVEELHVTPGSASNTLMQELAPFTTEAKVVFPAAGSNWGIGETDFIYLSPADAKYEGNNDSLVLLMKTGSYRILFTGDLEAEGEKVLLNTYGEELAGLTVLKVGHHGSKTSSSEEFLTALAPQLSIFSTGKDNRYGHPSPEVVERFNQLNLKTLNTADNGTIELRYDKNGIQLETMR